MSYENEFSIQDHMELTEEEQIFLNFYNNCSPDIRELLDKFMSGTPEEKAEAEAAIQAIVDDLRRKQEETE